MMRTLLLSATFLALMLLVPGPSKSQAPPKVQTITVGSLGGGILVRSTMLEGSLGDNRAAFNDATLGAGWSLWWQDAGGRRHMVWFVPSAGMTYHINDERE